MDQDKPFVPIASTPEMRNRLRELATPERDDFDRAVLIVLDDFERLYRAYEAARRRADLIADLRRKKPPPSSPAPKA